MTNHWIEKSLLLAANSGCEDMNLALKGRGSAALVGSMLSYAGQKSENFDFLQVIPSETTAAERAFLRSFFSTLWSGRGHVLEVGPYLGGTTRAIATGMMENPNRSSESKLCTFDRFGNYGGDQKIYDFAYPLVRSGQLKDSELRSLCEDGDFLKLFHAIHQNTAYGDLIVTTEGALRDNPGQQIQGSTLELPEGFTCDAVFIDGCKSWYGTKEFGMNVLPFLEAGCPLIFQDYGWHTTFWVSAFLHMIPDAFELFARVDTTYAFKLLRPVTASEIDAAFPDSPEQVGRSGIIRLFREAERLAVARSDTDGMVSSRLHLAAGLAYLGSTADCVAILDDMLADFTLAQFHGQIAAARKQPTYRPEAGVFLTATGQEQACPEMAI